MQKHQVYNLQKLNYFDKRNKKHGNISMNRRTDKRVCKESKKKYWKICFILFYSIIKRKTNQTKL